MSEILTSLVNPKVKRLVRLREKRARMRENVILVEGQPEINRFLETGRKVLECYFCPSLMADELILEKLDASVEKHEVSPSVFTKLAYGHRFEGILLVAQMPSMTPEDADKTAKSLCVVIEHVEKPGNLGAILRSCDGVGVDVVFVCDPNVDLYNPNVIRASLGTVFSRCVLSLSNEDALAYLRKNNIAVFAATPQAEEKYTQADLTSKVCIALGAEDKGLSNFWLQQADRHLFIPMLGHADSLNVSVSTGVILYEALRQKQN